ncbi:MAG: CpsD/CapB family tyrosine-protein kinase [bacterium]|nr:CpsD/CapB family tyrosine-protein kinase [bacterium]
MGRIAEALKKAERERLGRIGGDFTGAMVTLPPPRFDGIGFGAPGEHGLGSEVSGSSEPDAIVPGMSESLVAYYDRSSLVSEQYRALRTRLLSQDSLDDHRVLAVTSSLPKEGKTVTTINLAFTLAEIRHLGVLLVDADFRRSSLATALKLRSSPGLAELLAGDATYPEVIQKTPVPNLHFIAAGELRGHTAPELFGGERTRSVFRWFESQYHITTVDTPPATTVTDVGILGQFCSGVLMVVRMHRTPEPLAKRAVRMLQANNVPILGCLLVGRDDRTAGYGYRSNYGRYYDSYVRDDR